MPEASHSVARHENRQPARAAEMANRRVWPWALASMALVLIVLGGSFVGRHLIQSARQQPSVAAPAVAPLPVVAVTSPRTSYQVSALDTASGHLVALASNAASDCPPPAVHVCAPAPALQQFAVLDGTTGASIAATPLTGEASAAAASVALVADSATHRAYAIAPHAVVVFSTLDGAPIATYALPGDVSWQRESGAAFDSSRRILYLAGQGALLALDSASGHVIARQPLDASSVVEGPALDASSGRIYLLLHPPADAAPMLAAFDFGTLAPRGQAALPTGSRLGPFDSAAHALYLYGPDGVVRLLVLSSAPLMASALAPTDLPALRGTLALGWNASMRHIYAASDTTVAIHSEGNAGAIAALPLRIAWSPYAPLLVDEARGLLYLPDPRGAIVVARDSSASAGLTPGGASALAREAMARFLPDTNQDPPFVASVAFPLSDGSSTVARDASYWIDFSDLGWRGPYPGTAQTAVAPDSTRAGGYVVTFTITWDQLFVHTHTWVCAVAPDGSVRLRSERGDVVP